MTKARIFSIEEFSTFDGPGIRMTVFFKGCPLRCPWCHNPEGQQTEVEYIRNRNGCVECGACERAAKVTRDGTLALSAASMEVCPRNLIRVCGEDLTAQELAGRIGKNEKILKASGGGVTFSGGEPLTYASFILQCVPLLNGLHTALQTSGYAKEAVFGQMLETCDYFLYDLKIMDEDAHRAICGVDNAPILRNYKALVRSGKPFVTRIPLIPGYTDTEENLSAIGAFMKQNGVTYAEVLPYNSMAGSKYASLGRAYTLVPGNGMDEGQRERLFASFGITAKRM